VLHALAVQRVRDPKDALAIGRQREDPAYEFGFGLAHRPTPRAMLADVLVAKHATVGDRPARRPAVLLLTGPLRGRLRLVRGEAGLHVQHRPLERGADIDRCSVRVLPDLDPNVLDGVDEARALPGIAAQAVVVPDHHDSELPGGRVGQHPSSVHELRGLATAYRVVDVLLDHLPAVLDREGAGDLDLTRDRLRVVGDILLGRLPGVDRGDHRTSSRPTVAESGSPLRTLRWMHRAPVNCGPLQSSSASSDSPRTRKNWVARTTVFMPRSPVWASRRT